MVSILISGYYGFGNAGDEAMLTATLEGLGRRLNGAEFAVISGRPAQVETTHGVRGIGRLDLPAILRALRRADLFLSGGGSLLQDSTSFRNLTYHLALFDFARHMGARAMIYAQGVGPIRTKLGRAMAPRVLRGLDAITVRDPASAEVLKALGVATPPAIVTADPAFALEPCPPARVEEILREEGIVPHSGAATPAQPLLALAPRGLRHREAEACSLALVADWAVRHLKVRPLLVPMQHPNDVAACAEVRGRMKYPESATLVRGQLTPPEIMGLLGRCELVIGVRLHALVFAAAMGVPVAGVEYDPKVSYFLSRLGQKPLARLSDTPGGEDLVIGLEQAWSERAKSRQRLAEMLPEFKRSAERNFDIAAEVARKGRGRR